MSPIEIEIVKKKLGRIIENLKALEPIAAMEKDQYIKDLYKRKAAEKLLQEPIEAAIDINIHMIVETGNPAPEDYYESFIRAGDLGFITPKLAEGLAPSAGLRNRLVHEYDRIEDLMVLDAVIEAEELYPRYVKDINDYLSRKG